MWGIIKLGISLVVIVYFIYLFCSAPIGYQDERGFHYGTPDDKSDKNKKPKLKK